MIQPSDIILHLQTYLPAFTSLFSVITTATGTAAANTLTVTAANHGFSVGRKIIVAGGALDNAVAQAIDNGDGTLNLVTAQEHDVTAPKDTGDPTTITLNGFGAPWDGAHTIVTVPNRTTIKIAFPPSHTILPPIGTGVLSETRTAGIVGMHTIATVPDANTFTVDISGVPAFPTGAVSNLQLLSGVRVYGAADVTRAEEVYTALGAQEAALFVVMTDVDVSKDRHTLNDAIAGFTRQNLQKQIILQNFSTIVFFPTPNQSSGSDAQNAAYSEVYRAIASTLYGFEFEDPDNQTPYVAVSNGHGPGTYNTGFYTHVYDWQSPAAVTFESGFDLQPDVAFRDIAGTWNVNSHDMAQMQMQINLDDVP